MELKNWTENGRRSAHGRTLSQNCFPPPHWPLPPLHGWPFIDRKNVPPTWFQSFELVADTLGTVQPQAEMCAISACLRRYTTTIKPLAKRRVLLHRCTAVVVNQDSTYLSTTRPVHYPSWYLPEIQTDGTQETTLSSPILGAGRK